MKSSEFIIERVVNLLTPTEKQKYSSVVWDMMMKSYEKAGGFHTAASPEELIAKSGLWKLVRRDGTITAASLYKDQYGRKLIAIGTDGSSQGKTDYGMLTHDDNKFKRSWAEVSGQVEKTMQQLNATPIPAKYASMLTHKSILRYNNDGYHYTRIIGGMEKEKIIYGFLQNSPELVNRLREFGVEINELPTNINT